MAVTSVTENRVTITASASEDEIRRDAGFAAKVDEAVKETTPSAQVTDDELDAQPQDAKASEPAKADDNRGPDGKFKAKADAAPVKADKYGGDPRKSLAAKVEYERQRADAAERRAADAEARSARPTEVAPVAETGTPAPHVRGSATYLQLVKESESDPDWPKLEDFVAAGFADPYAACNAAQAAFLQDKRLEARDREAEAHSALDAARARVRASDEEGAEKYADWSDLMQSEAARLPLTPAVVEEIMESDVSADLRHYLLTHPDDLRAVAGLTDPIAAARAIGRLSARLVAVEPSGSGPVETPRGSRAKPLIKPVSASTNAPEASPPGPNASFAEHTRYWNDQDQRRRGARGA